MTSEFAQQYLPLSKEELLELEPSVLNQLRQEMGDQEFIDQWKLTQEEYSYLINELDNFAEGDQAEATQPVFTEETSAPLGVKEVLYATRRQGGATTTTTKAAPVVTKAAPKQTLTTSSYVPAPVSQNTGEVWTSETPAYQIVHAPQTKTVATSEPVVLGTRYAVHAPQVVSTPQVVYAPQVVEQAPVTYAYPGYHHGYAGYPYHQGYAGYHHGYSGYHHGGYSNGLRTSYVGNPGLRTSYVGNPGLRTSYVGNPGLRTSYVGAAPLRTSYVGNPGLRTSYVGAAPLRTSYIGSSRIA